ncbi:membrane protein [Bacteroidia bacterium]|nr:membrane protein [Bacteroidia bacterium]
MKHIILYSLLVLAAVSTSCNGFLEEPPKQSQSNDLTLATYAGLNKATEAAYGFLYDDTWYGAGFVLSSELRSGNAKNSTNTNFSSGRYIGEYNWNFSSSATSNLWEYAYRTIAAANNVLNNLEGKAQGDVKEADLDNIKGECLFLRALSYFDLLRTYAQPYTYEPNSPGVPIVLVTENGLPARNTVAEGYERIIADLLEAETVMADDYARANITDPFAAATKPAIWALLSRVYLYKGEWQKSADYATKVINSGKFKMFTPDELPDIWTQNVASKDKEVIFEVFGLLSNEYNAYWEEISGMTTPEGYADVVSTADLRGLYGEEDVRGTLFASHPDAPDHFWTVKYWGKATERPTYNNIIVLRLSEMYLNRAEALFRGAAIAGASVAGDLATIASNRNATPATPSLVGILEERRKELAFEGHIIYDMARTGTPANRVVDYDGAASAQYIEFPSYRWALPIPLAETNANPNCKQNEGY